MARMRPSGGYRNLRSFQTATIVYDATVAFCERFVDRRSRTVDQMIQAARSGRQNIAEGSRASATSSQTELRLVNVARSSLDELLLDYEDFLRQRGHRQWRKHDAEAQEVRAVGKNRAAEYRTDPTDPTDQSDAEHAALYDKWLKQDDPAIIANTMICLINQVNFLLDRQIATLEEQFVEDGGYSEKLAAARLAARSARKSDPSDPTDPSDQIPQCPECSKPMVLRTARKGRNAGSQFLGCSGYPACKGTVNL